MRWPLSGYHSGQAKASPLLTTAPGTALMELGTADQSELSRRTQVPSIGFDKGGKLGPARREAATPVEAVTERAVHAPRGPLYAWVPVDKVIERARYRPSWVSR